MRVVRHRAVDVCINGRYSGAYYKDTCFRRTNFRVVFNVVDVFRDAWFGVPRLKKFTIFAL